MLLGLGLVCMISVSVSGAVRWGHVRGIRDQEQTRILYLSALIIARKTPWCTCSSTLATSGKGLRALFCFTGIAGWPLHSLLRSGKVLCAHHADVSRQPFCGSTNKKRQWKTRGMQGLEPLSPPLQQCLAPRTRCSILWQSHLSSLLPTPNCVTQSESLTVRLR